MEGVRESREGGLEEEQDGGGDRKGCNSSRAQFVLINHAGVVVDK